MRVTQLVRLITLLALLLPRGLTAQSDSLREVLESDLHAMEARAAIATLDHPPPARSLDPAGRLHSAIHRLATVQPDSQATTLPALLPEFYEVTVRRSRWSYGWLGLGLVKLRLYQLHLPEIRSEHQPAGTGWLPAAQMSFERALLADPHLGWAAAGLGHVIMESPEGEPRRRAVRGLQAFAARHAIDADGALAVARVRFRDGDIVAAERFLDRFLGAGGDTAIAEWELASIRFAQGNAAAGATSYFLAAANAGPAVVRLLREDLSLIAKADELTAFDQTSAVGRAMWLRAFWSKRESAEGRPSGSRLPEHFRRVRYARAHFADRRAIRSNVDRIYRGGPREFDDKGVTYIRHGEPDERANYIGDMGTPPNESWLYFRPSGNLVFHFVGTPGNSNFVESLRSISGPLAEVYVSRAGFGTEYLMLAGRHELEAERKRLGIEDWQLIPPEVNERERREGRSMVERGTTTDSDPLHLDRTWEPVTQVFGTSNGLLVALALPAPRDLVPVPLPGGAAGYVIRVRTTAANDSGQVTLDVDSVLRIRTPRPLAAGEVLNLILEHAAPAGAQRVRVVIADSLGERGAIRVISGVPIPDLSAPGPIMTDLIVGREGSPVTWRHPSGEMIPLHPLNAWRREDVLTIAFDLVGLAADSPYHVRVGVADLGADSTRPPRASVEFEARASGGRGLVSQHIALGALRPGRYLLTVTVTAGDRSVRRERRITVAQR